MRACRKGISVATYKRHSLSAGAVQGRSDPSRALTAMQVPACSACVACISISISLLMQSHPAGKRCTCPALQLCQVVLDSYQSADCKG